MSALDRPADREVAPIGGNRDLAAPRSADGLFALALLAATTPIIVAAARAVARGWLPVGDDAYTAIRGRDVFGGHMPLLGTWSSASLWAHHRINHPGPLQFDAAAIPLRLLGPGAGVAFATAGVNVAAIVAAALLSRRLLGPRAATLTTLFTAGLVWAMGSELLYDPWSQYAPVLPFMAFLFAVWAVASGRAAAWPVLVIAGSYALQTHLSYSLLVPGLGAWAAISWVLAVRRSKREQLVGWVDVRRRQLRWTGAGFGALVICWALPLYQQITGEPGNLSELARSAIANGPNSPGPENALQAVGNIVAIPPFWLPPTWVRPPFWSGAAARPLVLIAAGLAVVAVIGVALAWLARRAQDRVVVAGLATAAVAIVFGFVSVANAKSAIGLVSTSYVRWLWPISMFTWTVLVIAVTRTARMATRPELRRRLAVTASVGLTGLAIVVGALAIPTADHGTAAARWAMPVTRELSRQAIPRLASRGPVLVRLRSLSSFTVGPALLFELQRHGIGFVTDDDTFTAQLGTDRRFDGTNARTLITVIGAESAADQPSGARRIAYVPGLDRPERQLMLRLGSAVRARVRDLHRVPLDRSALDRLSVVSRMSAAAAARRAKHGDEVALSDLARQDLIDDGMFGRVDIRRWADLATQWQRETTAVLAERVHTKKRTERAP